jgi:D-beta-D-heptose 7-phosphate kinase/D-beta-D-heptose 1-phosphate adenosyltransferase
METNKIIIIGDILLDINNTAEIKRQAPEADIPIYNILDVNYILGGAANVAKNLKFLDTNVEIVSVIGNDIYGTKIKEMLDSNVIKNKLFVDDNRKTTQKNRIFIHDSIKVRFDIEDTNDISDSMENDIIDYITNKTNISAIIISDYDKGVITEKLSNNIIEYANKNNIPTFVDPKLKNYYKYKNCFLIKPNQQESEVISGEKNIAKILNIIKEKIGCKNILLTRGKEGMILNNMYNKIEHETIINLVDVTGAGDTVLSVLVYSYLKDHDLLKASKMANYVGGKSVGVIGNYNITTDDINDYYKYEMTENISKIIYDYEIDKITKISKKHNIVFTNGCFDILHSAHIELLKFAKNQGDILIVGLNSDDSIKRLKGETRPINNIDERAKILSLFDFIDYIIVFSDDTPLNIITMLTPDVLIKGSDYNKENIIGKEFVKQIILFDFVQNKSSTRVINKIKNL